MSKNFESNRNIGNEKFYRIGEEIIELFKRHEINDQDKLNTLFAVVNSILEVHEISKEDAMRAYGQYLKIYIQNADHLNEMV